MSASLPLGWRLRAIAAMAIIPPMLEVLSFARIERLLTAAARLPIGNPPPDPDAARWVDRQLSRLPAPWELTCLRRAAVLYLLLRGAGRAVDLCIGVRRDEAGVLHAHAWLLHEGLVYLESESSVERVSEFRVIERFPNAAPPSFQTGHS